jgi:hypothetical protein
VVAHSLKFQLQKTNGARKKVLYILVVDDDEFHTDSEFGPMIQQLLVGAL